MLDPSTIGYSFFQNFLSDLGMTVAFGGQPNRLGSFLFMASFAILALTAVTCAVAFVRLYGALRSRRFLARAAGAAAAFAGAEWSSAG